MATVITPPLLAARHIPAGISATGGAAIIAGSGIATALCAALGIGVGAIIRNQARRHHCRPRPLLYVAEPLLGFIPHLGTAIQQYGLGGLAAATTHTAGFPGSAHLLGQPAATLILAGDAAAAPLAGARCRAAATSPPDCASPPRHGRIIGRPSQNPGRRGSPGTGPQAAVCAARPQRLHIRNPRRAELGITTWPPKPRQPGGHDTDSGRDKVARFPEERLRMVTAAGRDRRARSASVSAAGLVRIPLSLLFLKLSGYGVNAVQLHVNAADVLVRHGIDRDDSR